MLEKSLSGNCWKWERQRGRVPAELLQENEDKDYLINGRIAGKKDFGA